MYLLKTALFGVKVEYSPSELNAACDDEYTPVVSAGLVYMSRRANVACTNASQGATDPLICIFQKAKSSVGG